MPGPSFLSHELRGSSGNAVVRQVRGGTFGELVGTTGVTGAKETGTTVSSFYGKRKWVCRYKGNLYAIGFAGVYVFDPIALTWSLSTGFGGQLGFTPSGLVVCDTPSGSFLVGAYLQDAGGGNQQEIWVRFNGTSWGAFSVGSFNNFSTTPKLFFHKGIVYMTSPKDRTDNWIRTLNPVTGSVARASISSSPVNSGVCEFISVDDRLFVAIISSRNDGASQIWEFSLGAWVNTGVTFASMQSFNGMTGDVTPFRLGDAAYMFCGDGVVAGMRCWKFTVAVPGGPIQVTELVAPVPPALRAGSAIGTPNSYSCAGFVDTVSVPGSETAYVMFFPNPGLADVPTLFQFIDDSTPMSVAASPQITGSGNGPHSMYGGGELLDGATTPSNPLVTVSPEGNVQGPTGVVISFSAHGAPLVVPHDASGGAFTVGLVATQVPSGATGTILRIGPNEIWLTNAAGAWTNGQAITDTSTGAANQNAVATGGAADKTVVARFALGAGQTGLGVPITGICTIVPGSVTGGDGATDSSDTIINVTADGRTFSFEWDFLSDGIPQALTDHVELLITRP